MSFFIILHHFASNQKRNYRNICCAEDHKSCHNEAKNSDKGFIFRIHTLHLRIIQF